MTYTFGADPELFVFDTRNDKFVSVHNLLPGTKQEPHKVEHGAVQVDGVAAEFNIDPAKNYLEFARNIRAVRKQMLEMIQKEGGKHLTLVAKPTATFTKEDWALIPDDNKVLGCDPDYCGRTGSANPRPDPGNKTFRTGGGHVHIGWGNGFDIQNAGHFNDCRLMAMNLYNMGLMYDASWDDDSKRRQLYGSKYSFRPKTFGMEYRYLSNAWVDNHVAMRFVFKVAQQVVEQMDAHFSGEKDRPAKRLALRINKAVIDSFNEKNSKIVPVHQRGIITPWVAAGHTRQGSLNFSTLKQRL